MARKFNVQKFIKDVLNDEYAIIVGNEIIMDKEIEPTGDVHQYFLRKVNEFSNERYEKYLDIAVAKGEKINPVRQLIESGDVEIKPAYVSSTLKEFFATKLFTTILTTTTDEFLEKALREIWGDELRVVNIYDKSTVDEFQKAIKACRKGKVYNQPTLIYVFGKMDPENWSKTYVRTEKDAILSIETWIKMSVESSNELLEYLHSKRILTLGCKYDNWFFRFFWYVLTGSFGDTEYYGNGEVAFSLDTKETSENKLRLFLDFANICVLGDAEAFMKSIIEVFTKESDDAPLKKEIAEKRRKGGIFISYCNKDALQASQLFFHLAEKKYDVWLDNSRLYGGDNYEQEIANALSAAKMVITILSPNIAEDLKNNDTDHYYNKEWKMAGQFDDKIIIPVAIDGYDLRAAHHQKYEEIIGSFPSGINLMESDGMYRLIQTINERL